MKASFLVLNIAVNLERLSRWSSDGNEVRVNQFLKQTEEYVKQLQGLPIKKDFLPTLNRFEKEMEILRKGDKTTIEWAERALTWANILTHRAKLA